MVESAVILVHTTSHAVAAERVLRQAGLQVKLVPTPRHLSSDCGMAVRILAGEQSACQRALEVAGVLYDRMETIV
jgi:hypothetical protein